MEKIDTSKQYKILHQEKYVKDEYFLTAVSEKHIESIRSWRNSQMNVLRQQHELSFQDQIDYYTSVVWPDLTSNNPRQLLFSFFKQNKLIGYGGLVHLNWEKKIAEVSFLLSTNRMKKGSQYQEDFANFIGIISEVAFHELNFRKLVTETFSFRDTTIKNLEKAGFIVDRTKDNFARNSDSIFHCLLPASDKSKVNH